MNKMDYFEQKKTFNETIFFNESKGKLSGIFPSIFKKTLKSSNNDVRKTLVKIRTAKIQNINLNNSQKQIYELNQINNYNKITEISEGEPIYLNIYNVSNLNLFLSYFGIGIYHTSLQVYKTEYCYGYAYDAKSSGIGINENDGSYTFKGK